MSITASLVYLPQLDPTSFVLQDTTPYAAPDSKANISARTLTILDYQNNPLPNYPNPINFPIGGSNPDTFTIVGLTNDMALSVLLTLTPVSPQSGSVYTATIDFATNRFLQQGVFNIQVAQNNALPVSPVAVATYRNKSMDIIISESNSQTALLFGDFTGSQNALNIGQNVINNVAL